jgi:hypothetical protein
MEDSNQTEAKGQSVIENIITDEVAEGLPIQPHASSTRRSGGPRTAEGKRRSCQNAHKHGLYTDESFLEGAALELGEDPRQFQRLLRGLIEARRPVGALELAVIEDIALLLLKKARLDKAELAVQVSNLHQHDLERRKQMIQVGHNNSEASEWDVREHGLRRAIGSPGQYEQVLALLGTLMAMIDFNEFDRMEGAMRNLYGTEHTLRGGEIDTLRVKLTRTAPQDESFQPLKKAIMRLVAEELAVVVREYELFLHEHVENTRAARVAATAPSHAQWAAIIRQQNSLNRQLEHKIRLLMELQRERKSEAGAACEPPLPGVAAGQERDADTPDGGTPAPPMPFAENTQNHGVANTSRGSSSGCARPSPQAGQERDANMPKTGTTAPPMSFAENTQNRGNELQDLLQTQGISENAPSKRTDFFAQNEPPNPPTPMPADSLPWCIISSGPLPREGKDKSS